MAQTTSSNPIAGLHKQKMYSLILGAIGLVTLLLPWLSVKVFGMSRSWSGLSGKGWALLSLIGLIAVIATAFIGNKTAAYDETMKKVVLGGFGAMALGAVLFLLRKNSVTGGMPGVNTGIGLWLCLAVGVLGVLLNLGIVKPPKSIDDKVDSLS
jgi:hypothetical protein